jgi:hypothetical protein
MVVDDSAETSAEIARLDLMESPLSIKEAIFVEEHTSEALSSALGQFQSLRGKAKSAKNRRRIAIDSFQHKIKDEPLPVQPLCHDVAHGTIITVDEALTILRERSEDDIKGNWQDAEAFLDIIQAWRDDATEENTNVQEEEAASVTPGKRSIEQVGDTEADEASLRAALLLRLPSLQDGLRELELDICEWGYYREEYYHRQVEADRLFDNHCEPMVTDMIMLFMIPVGIPPDCLYDIIQVMEHVRSLGIDLVQAESMVCDDEWRYMVTGRSCAMFLRLKRPREFEDGSSPLSTTLPRNFLHQDVLRVPHLDEKSGNKPSRLTLGCTAVSPSWRNPDHPTNEIAVLRGIHCDQGYFEASMAAATAMVCSSTLNTMQLHPEIELHLTPSFRRVFKKPTEAEVTQGLYKIGLEITLLILVDCLPTLAQDECLKKQLLDNLGMNHTAQGRKQWSERERSGNNFMLCASTLTPEYSNNYPAIMLRPSPGQITVITNLRSGQCLGSLVRQIQWSEEVPIKDILSIFIKRAFSNDDKGCIRPTRTSNGMLIEGSTDTCIIKWIPGKTPGRFAEKTLKLIVELSRGGATLGAHEPFHEVELWVVQMRQLNAVINANLKIKGTPHKFTADVPKAKSVGNQEEAAPNPLEGLGMLKLRPWNKVAQPETSDEISTPGSVRHTRSPH